MEPARLRKLLDRVSDAIASSITPTAHHAGWLATFVPKIVWSDRPQQPALNNLPTSRIDKDTSMPVSLLTKVV